jgi:hypothetical protein
MATEVKLADGRTIEVSDAVAELLHGGGDDTARPRYLRPTDVVVANLAMALARDACAADGWWQGSSSRMTWRVRVASGQVLEASPVVARFIGDQFTALATWFFATKGSPGIFKLVHKE